MGLWRIGPWGMGESYTKGEPPAQQSACPNIGEDSQVLNVSHCKTELWYNLLYMAEQSDRLSKQILFHHKLAPQYF